MRRNEMMEFAWGMDMIRYGYDPEQTNSRSGRNPTMTSENPRVRRIESAATHYRDATGSQSVLIARSANGGKCQVPCPDSSTE